MERKRTERDRVTADDAAPETLLEESAAGPADAALSVVPAPAAGFGGGRDEAEDACAGSPGRKRNARR